MPESHTAHLCAVYDALRGVFLLQKEKNMESKPFWQSKTFWANVVAFGATVATAFGLDLGLDTETQAVIVAGVMSVVNIVLRFVTKTPVTA